MTRPRSIPEGLVVELSRAKVLPGAGAEADRWMRMLAEESMLARIPAYDELADDSFMKAYR